MAPAKKRKTRKKLGRDSKGNPVSLESKTVKGLGTDPKALAQRRGDGVKGAMNKEQGAVRKRRQK